MTTTTTTMRFTTTIILIPVTAVNDCYDYYNNTCDDYSKDYDEYDVYFVVESEGEMAYLQA